MFLVAAFTVSMVFVNAFECETPSDAWSAEILLQGDGTCTDLHPIYYGQAVFNIVSDLVILMKRQKRLAVIGIFSIGSIAVLASIIRIYALYLWSSDSDVPYQAARILLWSQIEINTALISSSIPALKPLFKFAGGFTMAKTDGYYVRYGDPRSYNTPGSRIQKSNITVTNDPYPIDFDSKYLEQGAGVPLATIRPQPTSSPEYGITPADAQSNSIARNNSSKFRVLVVGASIAGPTTAYWLARAGASVTVIERFPELRRGGQNVDIRTTGVNVMRRMEGMEPAVRATLHELEGLSFVTGDGRPLATMRTTGDPDSQFLLSEYEILRGDLSRVLYDLTKDDERIRYVFGEQVKAIKQNNGDDSPVTVEFMNGMHSADFDIVVACDGATSRTRAIGFDCDVFDHVERLNTWFAWFTIQNKVYGRPAHGQAFSAPGGRSAIIGPDSVKQHKGTKATLVRNVPLGAVDATIEMRQAAKQGVKGLKAYFDQHYRGMGWITDALLDDMIESDDFYASEVVQVKLPKLYKGRFVVVGDAGYAPGPTGTGTSLAMTGAYILAGELASHKGDLAAGLASYEAEMRPIIKEMQVVPPGGLSILAPQTATGIWFRNTVFRLVCWAMKFKGIFSWLASKYSVAFGKNEAKLTNYKFEGHWRSSF
ncbi:FAD binding domain-containing protein [Sarocladium implicatum]|nr:FAD binding domain-containing protein [Sarocladium implicatum]